MTYDEALQVLRKFPETFRRVGPNYSAWEASEMTALARFVSGDSSIISQISSITTAHLKWLDVFGQLMGIARKTREQDSVYATRVQKTCVADHCSSLNIISFLALSMNLTATISESLPDVGWTLELPDSTALTDEAALAAQLVRVRPAGVPFGYTYPSSGLYMTTNVFRDKPLGYGSFMVASVGSKTPTMGGSTNAALSDLPTPFLTDPVINAS